EQKEDILFLNATNWKHNYRLDEMINFPELKMKLSGAKIFNYHAICELGSTIGAVEEVDILSLDSKDIYGKIQEGVKAYLDNQWNEDDDYNESEDDLLDSQDLEKFIKDEEPIPSLSQEKGKMNINAPYSEDAGKDIADKATARAMAKD
ncbi:hypothetical protein ACJX0J_011349, partial [Zea mays]